MRCTSVILQSLSICVVTADMVALMIIMSNNNHESQGTFESVSIKLWVSSSMICAK